MTDRLGHMPLWIMAPKKVPFLSEWILAKTVASKVGLFWAVTWGMSALTAVSLSSDEIWRGSWTERNHFLEIFPFSK